MSSEHVRRRLTLARICQKDATIALLGAWNGCCTASSPKEVDMNRSSLVALVTTVIVGCAGAAEEPSPRAAKTTGATATTEPADDTANDEPCVPEGTKANDKGVGGYCDAQTRCPSGSICTGDFGAGKGAQFCTFACSSDAECGGGATCFKEARGSGCVPVACQK